MAQDFCLIGTSCFGSLPPHTCTKCLPPCGYHLTLWIEYYDDAYMARSHFSYVFAPCGKKYPPHDLDISLCMGSSESRQASVSALVQAAFPFQSWLGREKCKSLFGNILWYKKVDTEKGWLETCVTQQCMATVCTTLSKVPETWNGCFDHLGLKRPYNAKKVSIYGSYLRPATRVNATSLWHVRNASLPVVNISCYEGGILRRCIRRRVTIRVYLHHVEKQCPPHDLNISLSMGSSELRQASVSLLLQAAFAFQSWLGTEKCKSLFGNILWYNVGSCQRCEMHSSQRLSSHVMKAVLGRCKWLGFTIRVYLHRGKHSHPLDLDLDISFSMGSSESCQASVSSLFQAACPCQSWLGTERRKSQLGKILWYVEIKSTNWISVIVSSSVSQLVR